MEVPPVPIPNTEVKLHSADDTWWATARESRLLPVIKKAEHMGCTLKDSNVKRLNEINRLAFYRSERLCVILLYKVLGLS